LGDGNRSSFVRGAAPSRESLPALAGAALLPAALTAYFAFESGGYFAGAAALVAAELAILLALRCALSHRPLAGVSLPLALACLALAGYTAWTLASSEWSDAPARAQPEYVRALAYLLALAFFGALPYSVRRLRWTAYALAAAIVGVCVVALVSRTMPDVLQAAGQLRQDRLAYPLDYWNALGLLAGIGIVLCGHFACASRDAWAVRVLGAAAVPALTVTLYFTFSRGATWATLGAVAVYVIVGRPRGLLAGAIATVPTTAVALMAANPAGPLYRPSPLAPEAVAAGHRVALTVSLAVLAAAGLRALLLPLDGCVERLRLPERARRPVLAGAAVAVAAVVLAASAAAGVPEVLAGKYEEFSSGEARPGGAGSSRLLSGSSNGRREHWEVSLASFRRDRLRGEGAGTYDVAWSRERPRPVAARDGHSLYVETLGELGVPGLVAVAMCLLLILGAFAYRARGPDRSLFAAFLAAGLAWAADAAVDWNWEMPALTLWLFALGGGALAVRRSRQDVPRPPRWAGLLLRVAGVAVCLALAIAPARLAISEALMARSLESLRAGDCAAARISARDALEASGRRAVPHHVIAYCEIGAARFAAATRALERGLRQDPHSWALRQASAVARAGAGLDPRRDARLALALNPGSELVQETASALSRGDSRARRRAAVRLAVALPERKDP
jgi:hypothetical protein